jgi:hypothetical protein
MTTHTDDSLGSIPAGEAGEPVAELRQDGKGGGYVHWLSDKVFEVGTKLYTRPSPAPAAAVRMPERDEITVNLVRLAGLDKHKARECEEIVRQVLNRGAAAPAGGETTLSDRAKYYEECAAICERLGESEYPTSPDDCATAIRRAAGVSRHA